MTKLIEEQGHAASVDYRECEFRVATGDESAALQRAAGARVLAFERSLSADDDVVAFEWGVLPADVLPADQDPSVLTGSMFDFLEPLNLVPDHAVAEVRAVLDTELGWGPQKPEVGLYLCLDQVQFLSDETPISWSRTYFIEDRFRFLIVRRK